MLIFIQSFFVPHTASKKRLTSGQNLFAVRECNSAVNAGFWKMLSMLLPAANEVFSEETLITLLNFSDSFLCFAGFEFFVDRLVFIIFAVFGDCGQYLAISHDITNGSTFTFFCALLFCILLSDVF
mmetsp:Transcript_31253/g.39224  ORF Transcript_31253/g.39224 Transcript_31253/m.39224 type:complete len:126 (+) Transcript_31253:128-505(+)